MSGGTVAVNARPASYVNMDLKSFRKQGIVPAHEGRVKEQPSDLLPQNKGNRNTSIQTLYPFHRRKELEEADVHGSREQIYER